MLPRLQRLDDRILQRGPTALLGTGPDLVVEHRACGEGVGAVPQGRTAWGCHRSGASGRVALRLGPLRALLGRLPRPGDVGQHAHQFGPRSSEILAAAAQWAYARWRGRP